MRSYNKIRSIIASLDGLRDSALHFAENVRVLDVEWERVYHWVVTLFHANVEIVLWLDVIGAGTNTSGGVVTGPIQVLSILLHFRYLPFSFKLGQFLWRIGEFLKLLILSHFGCGICCGLIVFFVDLFS